jgi:hypothetical protein
MTCAFQRPLGKLELWMQVEHGLFLLNSLSTCFVLSQLFLSKSRSSESIVGRGQLWEAYSLPWHAQVICSCFILQNLQSPSQCDNTHLRFMCVYIYISYAIFLVRSLLKCVHAPGPSNVRCHLSPCWCCRRFHLGTKKIMHKPSRAGQWNHCHILLQSLARPLRGTWFEDKCNGLHYVRLCKLMFCTCLHPLMRKKVFGSYVFASAANAMIPAACNICNSPASRWSTDLEIGPASLKSHRFNQHQWKRLKQH